MSTAECIARCVGVIANRDIATERLIPGAVNAATTDEIITAYISRAFGLDNTHTSRAVALIAFSGGFEDWRQNVRSGAVAP
jgi:hypothetical protein